MINAFIIDRLSKLEEVPADLYVEARAYMRTNLEPQHLILKKIILEYNLQSALANECITIVEGNGLLEMLNSPDNESFELASMMITQLTIPVKFG